MVAVKFIHTEDKDVERQETLDVWGNTIMIYIFVILAGLVAVYLFWPGG